MSNLDYSISILIAEHKEIQKSLQYHGDDIIKKGELLDGIKKAIGILVEVKIKEDKEKHLGGELLKE